MIGILKTNGMKLEPHGTEKGIQGVALYPIYCLINHSCFSNTNYVKFPDLHLELRSQIPIKKGEQIYTRYISATIGMLRFLNKVLGKIYSSKNLQKSFSYPIFVNKLVQKVNQIMKLLKEEVENSFIF